MEIMKSMVKKAAAARDARSAARISEAVSGVEQPAEHGQQVFMFQPMVTLMGTDTDVSQAVQPFRGWFDGQNAEMVQFRIEILWCDNAELILESSPFPEEDPNEWSEVQSFVAYTVPSTGGFVIVTAVSDSDSTAAGLKFSRYIRWRVCKGSSAANWAICFRIKGVVGTSFTQKVETPRLV